jgi:hypothetical protein
VPSLEMRMRRRMKILLNRSRIFPKEQESNNAMGISLTRRQALRNKR